MGDSFLSGGRREELFSALFCKLEVVGVRGQGLPTDQPHRTTDTDLLSCWTDWKGYEMESSPAQLKKFVCCQVPN